MESASKLWYYFASGGFKDITADNKFVRINQRIQASQLRVISADGTQIGIMSREEALKRAEEEGLDLVEIAPQANPPVAKIIDFTKYKYQEKKKEQAAKKHAHEVELKEIWLSPRIAEHDLEIRLRKAKQFLSEGNRVKITVKFKSREMSYPEQGQKIVSQALSLLGEGIKIERETKFEGKNLTTIVSKK